MVKTLLNPKSDLVFKLIFGNKENTDILKGFLQSVLSLPPEEYERLEIGDPFLYPSGIDGKISVLDIKVYTKFGMVIDVEIQILKNSGMRERIVSYLAKMLAEQLKRGSKYKNLKKVVAIVILDYILIEEDSEYFSSFQYFKKNSAIKLSDITEAIILVS